MTRDEARCCALVMLRSRLSKPWWPRSMVEATTYEGSSGPGVTGYLMAAGKISVPSCLRHGEPGTHAFRIRDLIDEIEAGTALYDVPQADLFSEAA